MPLLNASDRLVLSEKGIRLSTEFAARARLRDVRLIESSVGHDLPTIRPLPTEVKLSFRSAGTRPEVSDGGLTFFVDTWITLELGFAPESRNRSAVRIRGVFRSTYEMPDWKYKDHHLTCFAMWHAQYNCWPHLREFVESMTVRMGFPPYRIQPFELTPTNPLVSGKTELLGAARPASAAAGGPARR